jgi:hypothetical protein
MGIRVSLRRPILAKIKMSTYITQPLYQQGQQFDGPQFDLEVYKTRLSEVMNRLIGGIQTMLNWLREDNPLHAEATHCKEELEQFVTNVIVCKDVNELISIQYKIINVVEQVDSIANRMNDPTREIGQIKQKMLSIQLKSARFMNNADKAEFRGGKAEKRSNLKNIKTAARKIHTGPQGGKYYVKNGRKVYC